MSIISVNNMTKRYGANTILENLSCEIAKGEVISIIGPSGTGKSTFLRGLNMLDPPTSGEVTLDGETINRKNIDRARRKMGMVFQNFGLFSHMTVLENLIAGQCDLLGKSREQAEEKSRELLKTVGLSERAGHYPSQLSGGQKQRAAIARCLAMEPEIILFDEPTSALDPAMVGEVMGVIRTLAKNGQTMLIVTHEMNFARDVSTRVFYMDERGIYESGTPEQIFEKPQKPKTQNFIFRVKSYEYEIASRDFDIYEMLGGLENFCYRNAVDKKTSEKLRLLVEELIVTLIMPQNDSSKLVVAFAEKLGKYTLTASYTGQKYDVLLTDEIAEKIVRKLSEDVIHEYHNGINFIKVML